MKNDYKKKFMRFATSLDAIVDGEGDIVKYASAIIDEEKEDALLGIYRIIVQIIDEEDNSKEVKQAAIALREALFSYLGYVDVVRVCTREKKNIEEGENKPLEQLLDELNELVGLSNVKNKVNDLIAYQKVQKIRKVRGYNTTKNTMHMAFIGNPGTGKTTVARIVGHVYKQLGLLSKGHFVEVSRTDLIAGYQGQTALKVKKVIEESKGGVLFIDEAYSITENDHTDSYGRECLTELTKALEDYRDDLVVIVAGYTEPMKVFFESNPGLKSRFNTYIEFDDYSSEELINILESICNKNSYMLDSELKDKVKQFFDEEVTKKEEHFANGRLARNIYDDLVMHHAKRVAEYDNPSDDDLILLKVEDFKEIVSV